MFQQSQLNSAFLFHILCLICIEEKQDKNDTLFLLYYRCFINYERVKNAKQAAPSKPLSSFKVDLRTFTYGFTTSNTRIFTNSSTSSTKPSIFNATEPPKKKSPDQYMPVYSQ